MESRTQKRRSIELAAGTGDVDAVSAALRRIDSASLRVTAMESAVDAGREAVVSRVLLDPFQHNLRTKNDVVALAFHILAMPAGVGLRVPLQICFDHVVNCGNLVEPAQLTLLLTAAVRAGCANKVDTLLWCGADAESACPVLIAASPLEEALRHRHDEIVRLLVDWGATVVSISCARSIELQHAFQQRVAALTAI